MKNIKKGKFAVIFGIAFLILLIYLFVKGPIKNLSKPSNVSQNTTPSSDQGTPNTNQAGEQNTSQYSKLLIQREGTSKITQLIILNFKDNSEAIAFTDVDEDFQIKILGGILDNYVIVFATQLNETAGTIWRIALDGSGKKESLFDNVVLNSLSASSSKILYSSYDNVGGLYILWTSNHDGKFKTKIFESETPILNPIFIDEQTIALVKLDQKGNGKIITMFLDGKKFEGRFYFDAEKKKILEFNLREKL